MVPAQQRLCFFDLSGTQVNDGLVDDFKLCMGQCAAQVGRSAQTKLCRCFELWRKEAEAIASRTFCHIQSLIGVLEQIFDRVGVAGVQRHAQTGRDKNLLRANWKRPCQLVQYVL